MLRIWQEMLSLYGLRKSVRIKEKAKIIEAQIGAVEKYLFLYYNIKYHKSQDERGNRRYIVTLDAAVSG